MIRGLETTEAEKVRLLSDAGIQEVEFTPEDGKEE